MSPLSSPSHTARKAKILATLGPSSTTHDQIQALVMAGANAFRLNFSHGSLADHTARLNTVRAIAQATGRQLPVLMDLQGPKIRLGDMAAPVQLTMDATVILDLDPTPGDYTANGHLRVSLPHPQILATLQPGDDVLINDGVIRLNVTAVASGQVTTRVITPGLLSSRKGVNVPGRALPMSALTPKDLTDLADGLALGVDWVALSFVQTAADVTECQRLVAGRARVMAKIETRAAIDNLAEILAAADGLMVARGDLGVELPTEDVPPLQKRMIELARQAGKPVVVATQMLESMVQNPRPTRAEANDVANAAYDGADCLMLSAESASGAYPADAVAVMDRIIRKVEQTPLWRTGLDATCPATEADVTDAVALAACRMVASLSTGQPPATHAVLVTFTESGQSTRRVVRQRTQAPVVALTPHAPVARQVELGWGVTGLVCPPVTDPEDMVAKAREACLTAGLAQSEDTLVVVAGVPFGRQGTTNLIRVATV